MLNNEDLEKSFTVKQEGDLIMVVFLGTMRTQEDSENQAKMVEDKVFEILNRDPNKSYKVLVDVNLSGGFNYMSPEARKIYLEMAKLRQFKKAAVVGNNTLLEAVVNLIMQSSGKELNFKWFNNLEEARNWLNTD